MLYYKSSLIRMQVLGTLASTVAGHSCCPWKPAPSAVVMNIFQLYCDFPSTPTAISNNYSFTYQPLLTGWRKPSMCSYNPLSILTLLLIHFHCFYELLSLAIQAALIPFFSKILTGLSCGGVGGNQSNPGWLEDLNLWQLTVADLSREEFKWLLQSHCPFFFNPHPFPFPLSNSPLMALGLSLSHSNSCLFLDPTGLCLLAKLFPAVTK